MNGECHRENISHLGVFVHGEGVRRSEVFKVERRC